MIGMVKYKVSVCVNLLLIVMMLMSAFSFLYASVASAAEAVSAYFTEPQPLYEVLDNGTIHIKCYWVKYESETYYLVELDAIYPSGTHFGVKGSGISNTMWLSDLQPVSGNIYTYRLDDGRLLTTNNANGVQTNQTFGNLNKPNYFKWVNNTVNNGFFPSDPNVTSDTQGSEAYPIEWARDPIPINHYRSYLPEPKADQYNKYVVLTGQQQSILLWFSYRLSEMYTWETVVNGEMFQYDLREYITPAVVVTDQGFGVYATVPQSFLDFQQIVGFPDMISLQVGIYVYDLITGQYISSTAVSQNGFVQTTPITLLSLPPADGIDGIEVYGAQYINASEYYHLHKASVTYSVDPSWDEWQSSVIDWLQRIYNQMAQTVEDLEDVTVDQNMSAADQMESAREQLGVTDVSGNKIDAAEQASRAFQQAEVGLSDMAEGFSQVGQLTSDIININPKLIILIIVALAAGIIVTILGKKV